jgi:hypothetical protein
MSQTCVRGEKFAKPTLLARSRFGTKPDATRAQFFMQLLSVQHSILINATRSFAARWC